MKKINLLELNKEKLKKVVGGGDVNAGGGVCCCICATGTNGQGYAAFKTKKEAELSST